MNNEEQITNAEAQSALESLNKIERETISSLRPPLWLVTILSLLCGIFTFSLAVTEHENSWALVMWLSAISVVLLVLFTRYSERLLGVPIHLLGTYKSGRPETRVEGAFPIADLPLAPYIAAIIVSLSVAYLTYKYPTNEWVPQDDSK